MVNTNFEKIRSLVAKYMDVAEDTITKATTLEELEIDSLEEVELVMELEDLFEIDLLQAATDFKTVGDFVDAVEKTLTEKTNG